MSNSYTPSNRPSTLSLRTRDNPYRGVRWYLPRFRQSNKGNDNNRIRHKPCHEKGISVTSLISVDYFSDDIKECAERSFSVGQRFIERRIAIKVGVPGFTRVPQLLVYNLISMLVIKHNEYAVSLTKSARFVFSPRAMQSSMIRSVSFYDLKST